MIIPVYAINLDRSRQRWDDLRNSADQFGVDIRRVEAVEGARLGADEHSGFDDAAFRKIHGKIALAAEIGCYFSHIRAFEAIIAAGDPYAVIVEDDIAFTADFTPFVAKLAEMSGWDVVKLVNHRTSFFRSNFTINGKYHVGRCLHGPLGSSAAYVVTLEGAQKLIKSLLPMQLPYDVALERGWDGAYDLFTVKEPLVTFSDAATSTISDGREVYKNARLPVWQRTGTLIFRAGDYLQRIIYALKATKISEKPL